MFKLFDDGERLIAGCLGAGGEHNGFHAIVTIEHDRLRGAAAAGCILGVINLFGFRLYGFAAGDQRLDFLKGERSGGRGFFGDHSDAAGADSVLHGRNVDGRTLGRSDQRREHVVGEFRARGDIERGCACISGQRGYGGFGCSLGVIAVSRPGGLGCGADQLNDLAVAEAAGRVQTHDQGTVRLRLGRENGIALGAAGGNAQHDREQIANRLAVAGGLIAVKVVKDDVLVGVDDHRAGAGLVRVSDAGRGLFVHFAQGYGHRALRTRNRFAREERAQYPRAVAAHTGNLMAAGSERSVQIIGSRFSLRVRGEGKARRSSAGNQRRNGRVGVRGLSRTAGALAGFTADHAHGHGVFAAHGVNHLGNGKSGKRLGAHGYFRVKTAGVREGLHTHFVKLPVAVHGLAGGGDGAHCHKQQAHERLKEKLHGFHA